MGRQRGDGHFAQESRRSELSPCSILKTFSKSILNDNVSTNSDEEVDDM